MTENKESLLEGLLEKGLTLYLWEREELDGWDRYLDLIVSNSASPKWLSEDRYTSSISEKKVLSKEELLELLKMDDDEEKHTLLDKFNIANLQPGPGIPKGPYCSVDEDVYEHIEKIRGILNIDKHHKKVATSHETSQPFGYTYVRDGAYG